MEVQAGAGDATLPPVTMVEDAAIEAAIRVHRALGPAAALRTLSPFLQSSAGRGRARVLLRMSTWAAAADAARFERLLALWEVEPGGRHADLSSALRSLFEADLAPQAVRLARSEIERLAHLREHGGTARAKQRARYDDASAHYLLGRALEAAWQEGAERVYDRAAELAEAQPQLALRARGRAVRVCTDRAEAARRAEALLPLTGVPPVDRLAVAVAALGAGGRYVRAGALDVLEELAAAEDDVGRFAIARAARHAEETALTAIEADRVRAVLNHAGSAEALEALRGLTSPGKGGAGFVPQTAGAPSHSRLRARAVAEGLAPGPRPDSARALVSWLALSLVHACGQGRVADARARAREATDAVASGARIEASLWTATHVATALVPEAAHALTAALLARGEGEPPPRGYLPLANVWLSRGSPELGVQLLRLAAGARESGARDRLFNHLRAAGWAASRQGDRERAIRLLEEAKRLSS